MNDRGSWFNKGACQMNTATHFVEVPFPQAFAVPLSRSSPFPCAPGYGASVLTREDSRSLDGYGAPFGFLHPSLLFVLWLVRSCFYLKERFTLEPAHMIQLSKYYYSIRMVARKSGNHACGRRLFIPWLKHRGFQARFPVKPALSLLC